MTRPPRRPTPRTARADPPRSDAPLRSGPAGERLARALLLERGYRIVATNLRTVHGEIDVLARDRDELVAVEVKARADHPAPERLVDAERLDRLSRALRALAAGSSPMPTALRIDVVAVRWQPAAAPEVRLFAAVRRLGPDRDTDTCHWQSRRAKCYASCVAALLLRSIRRLAARCRAGLRRRSTLHPAARPRRHPPPW